MAEHVQPQGWTFRWNNGVTMLGQAVHHYAKGTRRLELSRKIMAVSDEATVRDTILHEIAHINAGLQHGHDRIWKLEAIRLGASPMRVANAATTPNIRAEAAPWRGVCPNGHEGGKFWRKPRVQRSCAKCSPGRFNAAYLITYTNVDTGEFVR
jgi:hypothetical protein